MWQTRARRKAGRGLHGTAPGKYGCYLSSPAGVHTPYHTLLARERQHSVVAAMSCHTRTAAVGPWQHTAGMGQGGMAAGKGARSPGQRAGMGRRRRAVQCQAAALVVLVSHRSIGLPAYTFALRCSQGKSTRHVAGLRLWRCANLEYRPSAARGSSSHSSTLGQMAAHDPCTQRTHTGQS